MYKTFKLTEIVELTDHLQQVEDRKRHLNYLAFQSGNFESTCTSWKLFQKCAVGTNIRFFISWLFRCVYWYVVLLKENLNSYGQQFHQYEQKSQFPLASNRWIKKAMSYGIVNPGPAIEQVHFFYHFDRTFAFVDITL
jgi:hypothetical protein